MKTKITWLQKVTIPTPYYCLCLNQEQFNLALKQLKIKDKCNYILNSHSHATTHTYDNGNDLCCIVCLDITNESSLAATISLLVHESVHIYQNLLERIGEKETGKETEAYMIQSISQNLIKQYLNETNS